MRRLDTHGGSMEAGKTGTGLKAMTGAGALPASEILRLIRQIFGMVVRIALQG